VSGTFRLACVQVNAGADLAANVAAACAFAREARAAGAELIALPECVALMEPDRRKVLAAAAPEAEHPALLAFRKLARETGAWLVAGTVMVPAADGRLANRSCLIAPNGAVAARYDKIHMFDVDLPGGESYRESRTYRPGDTAVVSDLPWGRLGMTVCYDVRFPQLYRALAHAGADFVSVPSAFTRQTGAAHWHVLLRARAIECGAFVFAPAQCGEHPGRRLTYGHSLIVDPWGAVLADGGEEPGVIVAEIDLAKVVAARAALPTLAHDQPFAAPEATPSPAPPRQAVG
jgi:deaminated glutathione amidase